MFFSLLIQFVNHEDDAVLKRNFEHNETFFEFLNSNNKLSIPINQKTKCARLLETFCKMRNKGIKWLQFLHHFALRLCKWYDNTFLNCSMTEKVSFYGARCKSKTIINKKIRTDYLTRVPAALPRNVKKLHKKIYCIRNVQK